MPPVTQTAPTLSTTPKSTTAIEDYNEALRLKPDFVQAFSDRGAAWYFKGEYQKAIADYDEALRLEPNRARTYSNRSAAYRKLGRTKRAIESVTLLPPNSCVHWCAGRCHRSL
jgi:tetratricopeptide (TPR) repeat protein